MATQQHAADKQAALCLHDCTTSMHAKLTSIGHNVTAGVIDVYLVQREWPLVPRQKLPESKGCHLHSVILSLTEVCKPFGLVRLL